MVDEARATLVMGATGGGAVEAAGIGDVDVHVGTLSSVRFAVRRVREPREIAPRVRRLGATRSAPRSPRPPSRRRARRC